jgi:two-component system phosphate regulon response regulator PhoB
MEAADTIEASSRIGEALPSLILLDWMLPGKSGIEYARSLKRDPKTRDIPIIMLTAHDEEEDKVRGLESGADDYVTKPYSSRELVARIRVILRRVPPPESATKIEASGLCLDSTAYRAFANEKPLELDPKEFSLLHFLMTHPERAFSRSELLDQVWGRNAFVEERTVDVYIRRLRKVLEPSGHNNMIQTARGIGYRFSPDI